MPRQLEGSADLGERVARLAAAAPAKATWRSSGRRGTDSSWPKTTARSAWPRPPARDFAGPRLSTFRDVLGKEAAVERVEHIVQGDRRCLYRISPRRCCSPRRRENTANEDDKP